MPVRLIREDILSSDRVDALDFAGEVFYRRLLSKVDDFGLYDARPAVLRANLYPLRVDRVREADCSRWIAMCEKAGLIALYDHGGKPYLQALRTRWQTRSEPKYPMPPWGKGEPLQTVENSCSQPFAVVHLDEDVVVDVGVVVVEDVKDLLPAAAAPPPAIMLPLVSDEEYGVTEEIVAEFSSTYPAVDVMASLRRMRAWLIANPKNRKTRAGILRFVNSWLGKEQDNPRSPVRATGAGPPTGPTSKTGQAIAKLEGMKHANRQADFEPHATATLLGAGVDPGD